MPWEKAIVRYAADRPGSAQCFSSPMRSRRPTYQGDESARAGGIARRSFVTTPLHPERLHRRIGIVRNDPDRRRTGRLRSRKSMRRGSAVRRTSLRRIRISGGEGGRLVRASLSWEPFGGRDRCRRQGGHVGRGKGLRCRCGEPGCRAEGWVTEGSVPVVRLMTGWSDRLEDVQVAGCWDERAPASVYGLAYLPRPCVHPGELFD